MKNLFFFKKSFQFTLNNIQNNIFRLKKREDGEIIYLLNEGEIPRKFDLTTEKVYAKTVSEIFGEAQAATINDYFERAFAGEIVQYRVQMSDLWFETILSPLEDNGKIVEVAGSNYDITEKIRYQEEIERLNIELQELLLTDKQRQLYAKFFLILVLFFPSMIKN